MNYDAWFDYLRLLEADGNVDQIRDTYERAIANLPPAQVGHLHWTQCSYFIIFMKCRFFVKYYFPTGLPEEIYIFLRYEHKL